MKMTKKEAIALLAGKKFTCKDWGNDAVAIVTRFDDNSMNILINNEIEGIEYYRSAKKYEILGDAVEKTDSRPRPYTFEELAKKVKKGTVLVYGNVKKNGVRYGKAITGISTHQLFRYEDKWYNTTELFNKFHHEDGTKFGKY
jgi:hypothetical protein